MQVLVLDLLQVDHLLVQEEMEKYQYNQKFLFDSCALLFKGKVGVWHLPTSLTSLETVFRVVMCPCFGSF